MIATAMLPLPERTKLRWFSTNGCIEVRGDRSLLFVGGTLVGEFSARDRGLRNVLVVSLSSDPGMHLGHLATAFGIHEGVRGKGAGGAVEAGAGGRRQAEGDAGVAGAARAGVRGGSERDRGPSRAGASRPGEPGDGGHGAGGVVGE